MGEGDDDDDDDDEDVDYDDDDNSKKRVSNNKAQQQANFVIQMCITNSQCSAPRGERAIPSRLTNVRCILRFRQRLKTQSLIFTVCAKVG